MAFRDPTSDELRLIEYLVANAEGLSLPNSWRTDLTVKPMDDSGMGSLLLHLNSDSSKRVPPNKSVSSCQFADLDGIEVLANLYVDEGGNLTELGVWKTDFGKLIKIPESAAIYSEGGIGKSGTAR